MACTSTRRSPELPLPDIASPAIADLQAQLASLQHENRKLRRINEALIERVESGATRGNDPMRRSSTRWCWPSRCVSAPTP